MTMKSMRWCSSTFTAVATDSDPGDILTYSLVGAPAGAAIDPSTGVFTWTPSEAQGLGDYSFTVKGMRYCWLVRSE